MGLAIWPWIARPQRPQRRNESARSVAGDVTRACNVNAPKPILGLTFGFDFWVQLFGFDIWVSLLGLTFGFNVLSILDADGAIRVRESSNSLRRCIKIIFITYILKVCKNRHAQKVMKKIAQKSQKKVHFFDTFMLIVDATRRRRPSHYYCWMRI